MGCCILDSQRSNNNQLVFLFVCVPTSVSSIENMSMRFWPADPVCSRAGDLSDHVWDSMHVFWCFYGLCLLTDLGLQLFCGSMNKARNQW